jgi:hypothetical protein
MRCARDSTRHTAISCNSQATKTRQAPPPHSPLHAPTTGPSRGGGKTEYAGVRDNHKSSGEAVPGTGGGVQGGGRTAEVQGLSTARLRVQWTYDMPFNAEDIMKS